MNTQPTPETDSEEIIITKGKPTHWVSQEFARKLERERDEAREERDEAREIAAKYEDRYFEAREQRDRLAEALRSIKNELGVPQPEYPAPVANAVKIADAALQSLTPNAEP